MHGSRPTTGGDCVRGLLERLDGLPLRPPTVHLLLDPEAPEPAPPRPAARDDPGWAVAVCSGTAGSPLRVASASRWWSPGSGRAARATDRLWRFAVATSAAAGRLAAEAGDPDPEAVARAGLLHPMALWALAAVFPDRLGLWMDVEDESDRQRLEQSWFGRDAAGFGHRLARRWRCGPEVADAALLAAEPSPGPSATALRPDRLAIVRRARRLAMATPWAVPGPPADRPADDASRWLIAEVQARCAGGLAGAGAGPEAERLARSALRIALRCEDLGDELADLGRRHEAAVEALRSIEPGEARPGRAELLEAMAEFSAGAAHELNNPLAVIAGRAQLLRSRQEDPDARRSLQTIIHQARRAHQILRDLMYVARPPAPRQVPCVPDQILRAATDDLADEAASRQVRLSCLALRSPPMAVADPDALRHLADVLIRNALEATPEGGAVLVRSAGDGRTLSWSVRDSGIGLDRERAAHLLDPFFCGRQAGRGLGLGLSRVARFLDLIGGSIRWDPAPGGGTIARVDLPLETPDAESRAAC